MRKDSKTNHLGYKTSILKNKREDSIKKELKHSLSKKGSSKTALTHFYDPKMSGSPLNKKISQHKHESIKQHNLDMDISPDSSFLLNLIGSNDYCSDVDECLMDTSVDSDRISSIKNRINYFESRSKPSKSDSDRSIDCVTTAQLALKKRDRFLRKYLNPTKSNQNLKISQFSLMCTLGRGSFGRVLLAFHKTNNKFYAVKVLNKEKLVKNNQIDHTINERNIIQACDHPNIVKLYCSFKDNSYIYFITDLHCHSDLYSVLKRSKGFDEDHSRFYAANIFLALEYLHINDIIYRDLKPENILITSNGYLKLTDFGFAKRIEGLTSTMCGTPDYISPEVLSSKPYGKSADWWAFGVFIYELNAGKPPFSASSSSDTNALYDLIIDGSFSIPKKFSPVLSDICEQLIEKDTKQRLGCMKRESSDIRDHEWFDPVDWLGIYKQTFVSPYVPKTVEPLEIAFKNPSKHEEPLKISKVNQYKKEFGDF